MPKSFQSKIEEIKHTMIKCEHIHLIKSNTKQTKILKHALDCERKKKERSKNEKNIKIQI